MAAGISFGGLKSGLPPNIVEQLMEAERIPLRNMEADKGRHESRLQLVNELEELLRSVQGPLGGLANARGFQDFKFESGDSNIVTGSVDPAAAVKGNWNIEVLELAQNGSAVTNGFADRDKTQVGTGYFRFDTSEGRKEVYINSSNNTLDGIVGAINSAGIGVRASVIQDASNPKAPFRLVLTSEGGDGPGGIKYLRPYFLGGDQDVYFDQSSPSKNGRVKVDGFEFEIAGNQVDGVIPGVSLTLRQAAPGRQVSLSITEDKEVVVGRIQEFVESMNKVLGFLQTQSRIDANTDTSRTLGGDGLVRNLESRLRRLIQDPQYGVQGQINRMSQIGVTFNRSGILEFDQDQFNSVVMNQSEDVQRFLGGDGFTTGFIPNVRREIESTVNSALGPIGVRKRSLQQRIGQIDDRIANKERQLERREQTLRRQFSRLEETVSRLQSQGGALAAMGAGVGGL